MFFLIFSDLWVQLYQELPSSFLVHFDCNMLMVKKTAYEKPPYIRITRKKYFFFIMNTYKVIKKKNCITLI